MVISGAVGMAFIAIKYVPSSDVVAPSPDRIIPAASDMADGALDPDKLEVRVCEANTDQQGQELVFVYDGKRQVGTVGQEGYIIISPYEGNEWRCS